MTDLLFGRGAGTVLAPVSRRPTRLPDATVARILSAEVAHVRSRSAARPRTALKRPRVSIVIPTADNFVFLKLCLASLLTNTRTPSYELIVVDNGSSDETPSYLRALAERNCHVRPIFNDANAGFAAATNQGLQLATGDVLVLLNDDTVLAPGWLGQLSAYLNDPAVGLIGPVTNRAGNEAQVEEEYDTYDELRRVVRRRRIRHRGRLLDLPMLTMFCVALRRDVYERVGALDERFEVGMFEDDDYALRVRAAGYRIACAQDVFVHHFGATSLGKLAAAGAFGSLFQDNKRRFEEKWRVAWSRGPRPASALYERVIDRIRELVAQEIPAAATIAVVSRGDEALLDLDGRSGWHFPQSDEGVYAGHHPADSDDAIARLELLRARGAHYLLVPAPARWWLDHYAGFSQHLRARHRLVLDDDACVIFSLTGPHA